MNKSKLMLIFMEVLQNWRTLESLDIGTNCYSEEQETKAREQLDKDEDEYERKFIEALTEKNAQHDKHEQESKK
jgi:hypothetical protein